MIGTVGVRLPILLLASLKDYGREITWSFLKKRQLIKFLKKELFLYYKAKQ